MRKDIATCKSHKSFNLRLSHQLKIACRYETVGGIVAEEVGTFQTLGLPNEGVRTVGFVEITDPDGIAYRIDYQAVSKEAYITPRGEAPRTPPSIVKLLALLEAHK